MKVSLCILTYNRKDILYKLLSEISEIKKIEEVIVVDNASTDGTPDLFTGIYKWVNYIRNDKNIGVGARNKAFEKAVGDVIITIDDDIFGLCVDDINHIVKYFSDNDRVGAANFKVIDASSGKVCNWIHHCRMEDYEDKTFLTYEITEGAVAFRKETLKQAGFYPEYFFISHEGPDLAYRIMNVGYDVIYLPSVSVKHLHSEQGRKSWYRYYYDTRNQFWLAMRNFPFCYSLKFILRGLISTLIYSLRDRFLIYWLKGVIDGVFGLRVCYHDRRKLTKRTMNLIRCIDKRRPPFRYMVKRRLFRKEMRL